MSPRAPASRRVFRTGMYSTVATAGSSSPVGLQTKTSFGTLKGCLWCSFQNDDSGSSVCSNDFVGTL